MFVPKHRPHHEFGSIEEICGHLLEDEEGAPRLVRSRGPGGKAVFVFFDEETEACAAKPGSSRTSLGSAATPSRLEDRDHAAR